MISPFGFRWFTVLTLALLGVSSVSADQEIEESTPPQPRELWELEIARADQMSAAGEFEAAHAVLLAANNLADVLEPEESAPTLNLLFVGAVLGRSGDRENAGVALAKSRNMAIRNWSDDGEMKAFFLSRISLAYQFGENPEAAADALASAISYEKKAAGDASPELPTMYARLGALKANLEDHLGARVAFKKALKLSGTSAIIGVHEPYIQWLQGQGDHKKASHMRAQLEKLGPEALAAAKANNTPRPISFTPLIDEIVYRRWLRARQVAKANLDNDDPNISNDALMTAHLLGGRLEPDYQYLSIVEMETGYFWAGRGQLDAAEALYEMSLSTVSEGPGPESLDMARASLSIAKLRYTSGQYEESEVDATRALDITKKALGSKDPSLAPIYSHLGFVQYRLGEFKDALRMFEKDLKIMRAAFGKEDPSLIEVLGNCSSVASKLGLTEKAVDYAETMQWVRDAPKRRHAAFNEMMSAPLARHASAGSYSGSNGYGGFGDAHYDAWRAADDFWSDNAGKMGALGYEIR